jgi:hypothetical protein
MGKLRAMLSSVIISNWRKLNQKGRVLRGIKKKIEMIERIKIKRMIEIIRMRRQMLDRRGNQEAGVENRIEIETERGKNKGRRKGKTRGEGRVGSKIIIDKEKCRIY